MSRSSIRARVAAATEGPWSANVARFVFRSTPHTDVTWGVQETELALPMTEANGQFIAQARQDIPALLRLADAVAELMCHEVGWNGESPYWVYTGEPASLLRTMRDALADLEALP